MLSLWDDITQHSYPRVSWACVWGSGIGQYWERGKWRSKLAMGSLSGRSMLELRRVKRIRANDTNTERADSISVRKSAISAFTLYAYSVAAIARTVTGNEYAHHATLNLLIDLLNSIGLHICSTRNIYFFINNFFQLVFYIIEYLIWPSHANQSATSIK